MFHHGFMNIQAPVLQIALLALVKQEYANHVITAAVRGYFHLIEFSIISYHLKWVEW
jgi:hypothetical protein